MVGKEKTEPCAARPQPNFPEWRVGPTLASATAGASHGPTVALRSFRPKFTTHDPRALRYNTAKVKHQRMKVPEGLRCRTRPGTSPSCWRRFALEIGTPNPSYCLWYTTSCGASRGA